MVSIPSSPAPAPSVAAPADPARPIRLAGRHVHFVGIGGCGMSGLARLVRASGAACTGSDRASSETVERLQAEGVPVALEQTATSVPDSCQLLVVSAAIGPDHPELVEARQRGVEVVKYARMLGELMRGRCGVAVAGTHGKSTTTSMLCHILLRAGFDPSFIVGATCPQLGGGARTSRTRARDPEGVLVAEACEYDRSFHHLKPRHAVILNVEADHLDCYGSLDEIVASFAAFARKLPADGSLLIGHETPQRAAITQNLACDVQTLGFAPEADWQVQILPQAEGGGKEARASAGSHPPSAGQPRPRPLPRTRLRHHGRVVAEWASPMPGEPMASNAAAAAVLASRLGVEFPVIAEAIASFDGLDRRMQLVGRAEGGSDEGGGGRNDEAMKRRSDAGAKKQKRDEAEEGDSSAPSSLRRSVASIPIIDDYGHHPTEIDATLRALRAHWRPQRLVCVFQPHQHSRTRHLMDQFAVSFTEADLVIVPEIYFVRDSEYQRQAVTSTDLVHRLRRRGVRACHMAPFEAIVEHLQAIARPGDLVVTMGAGDVWRVGRALLAKAEGWPSLGFPLK